jgi:hypothetical protein
MSALKFPVSHFSHDFLFCFGHRYRPYKSGFRQKLASVCVISLMALCALLLRTQSLLSSSRSANFDPDNPSKDSTVVFDKYSPDLFGVIILTLCCLAFPLVFAVGLYLCVNSIGLQEKWEKVKVKVASLQLVAPRKQIKPPERFSLESPRSMQGLRSEISASRSASPFSPLSLHLQPSIPSHFRRPASPVVPIAASKYCPPAVAARASSEDAALEGEAPHSAQSHSASSSTRVYREFEGARRAQA